MKKFFQTRLGRRLLCVPVLLFYSFGFTGQMNYVLDDIKQTR